MSLDNDFTLRYDNNCQWYQYSKAIEFIWISCIIIALPLNIWILFIYYATYYTWKDRIYITILWIRSTKNIEE